jgi:thiol-disulfide isomerase/thioredoxin
MVAMKILAALSKRALLLIFLACTDDNKPMIKGDLKSSNTFLEGRMVYLKDWKLRKFVDSCRIKNGQFSFTNKLDVSGFPFRAGLYYETLDPKWPHQVFGYRNPIHKNFTESTLYAEPGSMELRLDTIINRTNSKEVLFKIQNISRQTKVAFSHYQFKTGSSIADKDFEYNKSVIRQHPYSIEMLETLNLNKSAFDATQLRTLMSGFSDTLRTHPGFAKMEAYLATDNLTGTDFPTNLRLRIPDGDVASEIIDRDKPYNLVVFWASWCAPCRMEIPQIKKLYENNGEKLAIASISIDSDQPQWKKALAKEKDAMEAIPDIRFAKLSDTG